MDKQLTKVRQLISLALSESYNPEEARTAAMAAVRLIHEHNLLDLPPVIIRRSETSELVDATLELFLDLTGFDSSWVLGVANTVDAVFIEWDPPPDAITRRRVYHRVRYRLEEWVSKGLLRRKKRQGYVICPGVSMHDFGFKKG